MYLTLKKYLHTYIIRILCNTNIKVQYMYSKFCFGKQKAKPITKRFLCVIYKFPQSYLDFVFAIRCIEFAKRSLNCSPLTIYVVL